MTQNTSFIVGYKALATYIGRCVNTARTFIKVNKIPIKRLTKKKQGTPVFMIEDIEGALRKQ